MIDRTPRAPDPFLEWKVRVFFAGALLLVAGAMLRRNVLVLLAIVVLFGGMVLMILTARHRRRLQAKAEAEAMEDGENTDYPG